MKKMDLNTLVQALAMFGVMGSLIFVGLQMKQSQEIALAAQNTTRVGFYLAAIDSLAEQRMSYQTMLRQNRGLEPATEDYRWFKENQAHALWFIAENDYLQHSLGLMDQDVWKAKLTVFRMAYNSCGTREIYELRRPMFDQRFVGLIESIPDECGKTNDETLGAN